MREQARMARDAASRVEEKAQFSTPSDPHEKGGYYGAAATEAGAGAVGLTRAAVKAAPKLVSAARKLHPREVLRALNQIEKESLEGLHIGSSGPRRDNCVACVVADLKGEGWTAQVVEAKYGYTGKERGFTEAMAKAYVQEATGSTLSARPVAFASAKAPAGEYVIFAGREHVIRGRIDASGAKAIWDPQTGERFKQFTDVTTKYGGSRAYRVE
ncbi:MAG: hypothetical protein IPM35_01750 [Myxococcales bacterium]|nr:hypothetical protein [Myxococcales bacterium]